VIALPEEQTKHPSPQAAQWRETYNALQTAAYPGLYSITQTWRICNDEDGDEDDDYYHHVIIIVIIIVIITVIITVIIIVLIIVIIMIIISSSSR
jgi:hypothetical protein